MVLYRFFGISGFLPIVTAMLLVGCSGGLDDGLPSIRAVFSVSDTIITNDESIQFFDRAEGNPERRLWLFEGGEPGYSGENNPVVLYKRAGRFEVSYFVAKGDETSEVVVPNVITVLFNPQTRLVAHYPFEDDASDLTSNAFNGVLQGNSFSFEQGVSGNGIRFANNQHTSLYEVNDYVELPDLLESSSFTIALWLKFESNAGFEDAPASVYSFGYFETNANDPAPTPVAFSIQLDSDGSLKAILQPSGALENAVSVSSRDTGDGNWHHIAVTVSHLQLKLYVDAQMKDLEFHNLTLDLSGDEPHAVSLQYWMDGGEMKAASRFNGMVDEVRIYDFALNDFEVGAVYNAL